METGISPVPREARPYQGERAGLVTRLVAATVDAFTVVALLIMMHVGVNVITFIADPRGFEVATLSVLLSVTTALVICVVYLAAAWSITGRTYGDRVMGLRVVNGRGLRVGGPRALLRALLCVGFPIGLLWCAASSSRRSVQDAVLRTSVIYDWRPRHGAEVPIPVG
ncbi:MAG: RDD family protein [Marmoricola sp.]